MSKEKIKASEVSGQLRKMANMYEVFKHAADAATVLASYETEEKKLKKSIEVLQVEFEGLDRDCDVVSFNVDVGNEELLSLNAAIKKAEENRKVVLHDTEVRSKQKAEEIVSSALEELESLKSEIAKLNSGFKDRKEDADKEYVDVCAKIKVVKENALKAFR